MAPIRSATTAFTSTWTASLVDEQWWENFRAGQVTSPTAPCCGRTSKASCPATSFQAEPGKTLELEIGLTLSTRDPISYLDLVQGRADRRLGAGRRVRQDPKLPRCTSTHSGWFLVRAVADVPYDLSLRMTAPYFVEFDYKPRISKRAVQFFLDWVYQRAKQIELADPQQRREVLEYHRKARDFWQKLVAKANAE